MASKLKTDAAGRWNTGAIGRFWFEKLQVSLRNVRALASNQAHIEWHLTVLNQVSVPSIWCGRDWERLSAKRTGRFFIFEIWTCVCERVFVFVWTMTVSVVPEELMSRWSEWDSAYSLSLLFTLALSSLCFCIYAFLSVCLSPSYTHSLFRFFIFICKLFRCAEMPLLRFRNLLFRLIWNRNL